MLHILKDLWYTKNKSRKYYLCLCDICWNEYLQRQKTFNENNVCKKCKLKEWSYSSLKKPLDRKIIIYENFIELELTWWEFTKIDKDIFKKIRFNYWYKSLRNSVESRINWKLIKLHRLIMNAPEWKLVDHINWDILDNRRCNLRICNHQQNTMNKNATKNSKSWIKWAYYDKTKDRYIVQVALNWKRYSWWSFKKLEDAIISVNNLTHKLHWEYAKQY